MDIHLFDYELPQELIAQVPLAKRDSSRLMVVHRNSGLIEHRHFTDIQSYLQPGDVLVRNNTRVIPARLFGTKLETNAHVELLLLHQAGDIWECLVGNARTVKVGTIISFGSGELQAECLEVEDEGIRVFRMIYQGIFYEVLDALGQVPLPPYIKEKLDDGERYQTVYASVKGSAAAPTAGLHFTPELLAKIQEQGIEVLDITLHVGLGTFRPMSVERVEDHIMHEEFYSMSEEVANRLNLAKAQGRRIISVGTTTTRTLEAVYAKHHQFVSGSSWTNIFIYPGYQFQAIDVQITNFHLPKSTLLMLVSAFSSTDIMMKAYNEAVIKRYRFFSFGDAMLIL